MNIKAHPIKITMLGLLSIFYGISGLLPHQAKAFSQGLADGPSFYPLFMLLPGFLLRHCLLQPMKLAVNGTALALEKALDQNGPGWCINLSGGYHHARKIGGGGFCYFNDTALALQKKIQKNTNFQALIIDCDFHCGDGNADFKSMYPNHITIIDIYGSWYYPFVGTLEQRSDALETHINYPNKIIGQNDFFSSKTNEIRKGKKNSFWYVDLLKQNLAKVSAKKFDCIIYNAGTDVYEGDELGKFMDLSKEQIIERDATVFCWAFERNIPIVQVLSGGYDKQMGAEIVADSAINIYNLAAKK